MDVSERELLIAIRRLLTGSEPDVVVHVGDDAAVVRPGSGDLVLTTDALVEGTHFDRRTTSARDLGCKAIAVNVSDVAAMAASPRYALCALTLSDDVDASWAMELFGGMRDACADYACTLIGGNVAAGREVTVAVTVTGEVAQGRAVTRDGARSGDLIVVTGTLGGAAAGLRLAEGAVRTWSDDERDAIRRQVRPEARVGEAHVLAQHEARAMIDVSDGFALDLARLCEASDVGARIEMTSVPVHAAAELADALSGGEDYELIATLPDAAAASAATSQLEDTFGVSLTVVGAIIEGGIVVVDADGGERPLEAKGWDHFGGE
jgi:thiamine-monophosphate kinase